MVGNKDDGYNLHWKCLPTMPLSRVETRQPCIECSSIYLLVTVTSLFWRVKSQLLCYHLVAKSHTTIYWAICWAKLPTCIRNRAALHQPPLPTYVSKSLRCVMTTFCGSPKFLVLKWGGPIRSLHFVGTFQVSSDTQPFKMTTFILLTEIYQFICRSFFCSLHSLLRTIGPKQIWGSHRMLLVHSERTSIHDLVEGVSSTNQSQI